MLNIRLCFVCLGIDWLAGVLDLTSIVSEASVIQLPCLAACKVGPILFNESGGGRSCCVQMVAVVFGSFN